MLAQALLSRRAVIIVAALLLAFAGRHAFQSMPRALEPRVDAPYAAVELQLPGASVAEIDAVLTPRVERELLGLQDLLAVSSTTRDGAVVWLVELPRSTVLREAALGRLEERLAGLRSTLGAELLGLRGPNLLRPPSRFPEILIAVSAADAKGAAPVAAARALAEKLRALDSVARVDSVGEPASRIVLTYDDRDLVDTGLSPLQLREYLRSQSFTAPGGYLERAGAIAPVETAARITTLDALAQLPVRDPDDGAVVALGRILDIDREALAPATEEVLALDRPAVVLAITRHEGAALAEFTTAVDSAIAAARTGDPASGYALVVSQAEPVEREVAVFRREVAVSFILLLGLLVVALGFRSGLAVAIVVPLVVAGSFVVFRLLDLGIDFVLLSSLVLVLGILVDNHIVIAERIHRLRERGLNAADAIGQTLRELAGPLATATATTALGFLPIWLTDHAAGAYVEPLFFVVLGSLAVSLVFSLFVTPLFLKKSAFEPKPVVDRMGAYRAWLARASRPARAFVLGATCVAATLFAIERLSSADQVFFPTSSQGYVTIDLEYPAGTGSEKTRASLLAVQSALRRDAAPTAASIAESVAFVGRSCPPFQASLSRRAFEPHYGQLLLRLVRDCDAVAFERAARDLVGDAADGARVRVRPVRLGAELEWPIAIRLRGDDAALAVAAPRVVAKLEELGARNVASDRGAAIEKLKVVPDREALAKKNLTAADLAAAMHSVVHGLPMFEIAEAGERIPVVLRAKASRKDALESLGEAYVYPAKGEPSLLYEVAKVSKSNEPPQSGRDRGVPSLTIRGEAADPARDLAIEREMAQWLETTLEPDFPTVGGEVDGIYASSLAANRALLQGVPFAALAVVLLLLVASRSVGDTLLVLGAIPVSAIGVVLALAITGQPFSFMVLVGMIALSGLVVNNAIVLVASLRLALDRHRPEDGELRAVLVAAAAERFRPLVLTTLCSIVSMIVLYQSGGAMWQPLAATILAGLGFATAIVVTVIPAVFIARATRSG